jgi:hypothetical protein
MKTPSASLSATEVRAIVLRSQGLAEEVSAFGLGKKAVLKTIQHLCYVQVDPINIGEKSSRFMSPICQNSVFSPCETLWNNLVFEPTFKDFDGIRSAFVNALTDFARFQECDRWKISRVEPKAFKVS